MSDSYSSGNAAAAITKHLPFTEPDYSLLPPATKDGQIPFDVATVDRACSTYYKIFGDLACGVPPLVCLHGGPGAGHESISIAFAELWSLYGIPIIVYDQIDLWENELHNLLAHFGLPEGPGYHLLGHSFGGTLAAIFAGKQPKGLNRLILSSGNASKTLSASGVLTTRLSFPDDIQKVLREKEEARDFDDADYKAAQNYFYSRYLFPGAMPPSMLFSLKNTRDDPTVSSTVHGQALTLNEGSGRHATSIPNLHKILAPTLVINGDHDTSHDISQEPFFELIPRIRWITLPNATHGWHGQQELRPRYLRLIGEFLTPAQLEERARARNWYSDTPTAISGRT